MNKSESNKLSMFEAVIAVLKENAQKISSFTMLNSLSAEFQSEIEEIMNKDAELKTVFAGKTNAKDDAKENLVEMLVPLANALYVFAKRNGNAEMRFVANVNKTLLLKMRENDLTIKANTIKDYLNSNKSSLGDFLITDEKITTLTTKISEFQKSTDQRDSGFANRVAARESLDKLFDKADDLLNDEMDGLMEVFKTNESDFYNAYQTARVIKDLGYRKEKKTDNTNPTPPPTT